MSDYKHGSMDIKDQEQTFEGFVKACTTVVIVVTCILLFLAVFAS